MPAPLMLFRCYSPRSIIIPETESEVSNLDSTSDHHHRVYPTSELSLGLDDDAVGRQKMAAEIPSECIGVTPERLRKVSECLQLLKNNHEAQHGNDNEKNNDQQAMDIFPETNPNIGRDANPEEKEDVPTLNVAVELMKELRKCIKELRVMYQMMQETHEIRKQEEAIRLTAYHDILQSFASCNYIELG